MKIALIGNQNSGKTTLFNNLTGSNQKIGNWPGVTLERKSGQIKGSNHELIDLPGIYSLSPYTPEEEISRNYIFEEKPELIINIVDSTSIERSLYLTTQLLELDTKLVLVLNMSDILEKKGVSIDINKLKDELQIDIFQISAKTGKGIKEFLSYLSKEEIKASPEFSIYPEVLEKEISSLQAELKLPHSRFLAVNLLERDHLLKDLMNPKIEDKIRGLEAVFDTDMEEAIAKFRYDWIKVIVDKTTVNTKSDIWTDKLDKIFLNKYLGIPIFVVIMFLVYFLSVGLVGAATVDLIAGLFETLSEKTIIVLDNWGASPWAISLVTDGIIAGVGAVLSFVPQLIILFLCISILETTGYMSRIAFLLDKLFRRFGLSGKALIPFIIGSGCSVPAVMATRTVEDSREREMLITLTPFIPCSARLPIIALFSSFFFDRYLGLITASLYFMSIIIIIISALILRKFVYKNMESSYISELPEYKLPHPQYVLRDVWEKTYDFIKRAGTIIFLCSIIVWVLLSFSWKFEYGVDIENSILASIGNIFSWLFYPILGEMSWGATVSALQGLVAKEQVVSSMSIIAGFSSEATGTMLFGAEGIFSFFTPASAYAYMAFNVFSAPCFGAIGAMRKEFGSMKKTLKAVSYQTTLAWVLASLIHLIGLAIGGF
ncbi:MAG: ferrous iron transport protein B [Bacilli bacterium]|nr:ferrous iron transport protein B [Bacilli bacterium]